MITMISKLQAQYEQYINATASRETSKRYTKSLNAFFDYFPEKADPREFAKLDVEDFKAYRRKKGVSATTVNYDITVLKGFWNWMINMDAVTYNPVTVKRLRQKEPLRLSLTEPEQRDVYAACLNASEKLLVALSLSTALRCQSMVELEKSNFDFERGMLSIPAEKMKSGRALELPLRADVIELVRALPEGRLWGPWAKNSDALSRRFTLILKRAGIGLRGLRTARRTVATTLLRNGADVRLVRDLLGHTDIKMTMKYLTPATSSELSAAIARMPV